LTPDEQFGLYLTVGVLITAIFGYLFLKILFGFFTQDPLILSDLRILNVVSEFRTPRISEAMLFFTYLCEKSVAYLGVLLVAIFLYLTGKRHYSLALLASIFSGEAFLKAVKILAERKRPPLGVALIREEDLDQSFPSGHAFLAVTFFGLIGYFIYRWAWSRKVRAIIVFLFLLLILAIGVSRIYLGVHWPSDVLASWTAGAAWLAMTVTVLEIRGRFNGKTQNAGKAIQALKPKPVLLGMAIKPIGIAFAILWLGYVGYYYSRHPFPAVRASHLGWQEKIVLGETDIPDRFFSDFPRVSETISGKPQEPIHIVIIGDKEQVGQTLKQAGWLPCDRINMKNVWRLIKAEMKGDPYPQAPGVPSLWDAVPNDLAYEKPTESNSVGERHHLHLWKTPFSYGGKEDIWFGTAHFDRAIKRAYSIIMPTHTIDPAIDVERENIKSNFLHTGRVEKVEEFQVVPPTLGKNQSGDLFFTDGKAYVFFLK
ncbi:MAG: phosphatase PAP2 family protein, partial [Candidatus Moranbacteria bacterium]|nr:phosphatase PAP2 family protein [Candidatus Moranbacteria bacterium]